jgi:hypothetical protein
MNDVARHTLQRVHDILAEGMETKTISHDFTVHEARQLWEITDALVRLINPKRCENCGHPLPFPAGTGRPRRFCNDACRQESARYRSIIDWTNETVEDTPMAPEEARTLGLPTP